MRVADEHRVRLGDKDFVLYAGLLAMAHEEELEGIDEEFIQVPAEENNHTAIIKAIARTKDGRSFSGIGDANKESVGRQVGVHYIRMASTRAKARALRDLCNVGEAAAEELGDGDSMPAPTDLRSAQRQTSEAKNTKPPQRSSNGSSGPAEGSGSPVTGKQRGYLESLGEDRYGSVEEMMQEFGHEKSVDELTKAEASQMINSMVGS